MSNYDPNNPYAASPRGLPGNINDPSASSDGPAAAPVAHVGGLQGSGSSQAFNFGDPLSQ